MQNTAKQNYPGSVACYDTRPGNEAGLFYNAAKPTQGIGKQTLAWLRLRADCRNAAQISTLLSTIQVSGDLIGWFHNTF